MEDHVPRHAQMGAWVLINDRWYYFTLASAVLEQPENHAKCDQTGKSGTAKLADQNRDVAHHVSEKRHIVGTDK